MTEIQSAFVSHVEPVEFGELAAAVEALAGREVTVGRATLQIGQRSGTGFAGAVCYDGTLRTGSLLVPSVKVELVVSPWSSARSELGIRPLTHLGRFDSLRSNRFYTAARSVLQALFEKVAGDLQAEDTPDLVLAA
jgi:hypothetical protein